MAINVRWDDFEAAFFLGSPDARYFLNRVTGEVDYTSHMDGESVRDRILSRTNGDDWLEIPRAGADVGAAEIRAFAEVQDDLELREALLASLEAKQPPMAFNKALGTNLKARRRWKEALRAGIGARLLAFCREHDLEPDDERFRALSSG